MELCRWRTVVSCCFFLLAILMCLSWTRSWNTVCSVKVNVALHGFCIFSIICPFFFFSERHPRPDISILLLFITRLLEANSDKWITYGIHPPGQNGPVDNRIRDGLLTRILKKFRFAERVTAERRAGRRRVTASVRLIYEANLEWKWSQSYWLWRSSEKYFWILIKDEDAEWSP